MVDERAKEKDNRLQPMAHDVSGLIPRNRYYSSSLTQCRMQIVAEDCKKRRWGCCEVELSTLVRFNYINKGAYHSLQYNGGMNHKQRDKAVTEFEDNPDKRILVASLKCGGLGLNLTMASKIICVDLWFNSFTEQQAFCRIFRIGQESETHINRFVLRDTVDEGLIALQERKTKLIGRALGDTEAFKHFSAEDLMRLFGHVKYDENDRPFIVPEDGNGDEIIEAA